MKADIVIRPPGPATLAEINAIYNHFVAHSLQLLLAA